MTNEMSSSHNGVTIGNYISINIPGRIDKDKDFDTYVCNNPLFMHEYGHTFDSREMGPMYLFTIGIPSAKSAANNESIKVNSIWTTTHLLYWTEQRASMDAYGPDLERWFTYYKKNGVIQYYTYYGVGYENCYHQEPGTTAYTLRTYYVNTPDGLSGIVRYDSRTSAYTPYAVETDHLGSITALYNSSGTKVLAAVYDTWGKRTVTTGTLEFRRGYTGHEHIDGYDLINMNGRVYDPLIGRFLSPDMRTAA